MTEEEEIMNALNILNKFDHNLNFKKICELSSTQLNEYKNLLEDFKKVNNSKIGTKAKGDTLEKIVSYLIKVSGDLFEIKQNLKTHTNEIDQLVILKESKHILTTNGILDKRFEEFICECKNYKSKVGVTYVGKFGSLMLTTKCKLGILFSYHGVTGKSSWSDSNGLIRKFYLGKEELKERYCLIDFNITDFEDIANGNNLLQIITDKIRVLKYDTDYSKYIH